MTRPATIVLDEFIDRPVEWVWAAMTRPELMAKWWVAGDVRPEVGHRFTLDMGKWGTGPARCSPSSRSG